MILVDSTCHCSLWRLTTIHFLVNIPSKTAEMEEKGQKNHYHRHQKALWRCGLNPFFKVSVTTTESQHADKQMFNKARWQWQTFCNFLFFQFKLRLSYCALPFRTNITSKTPINNIKKRVVGTGTLVHSFGSINPSLWFKQTFKLWIQRVSNTLFIDVK